MKRTLIVLGIAAVLLLGYGALFLEGAEGDRTVKPEIRASGVGG